MSTKSYTSLPGGLLALPREGLQLLLSHYSGNFGGRVAGVIRRVRQKEQLIEQALGREMSGLDVLDVGAGQRVIETAYYGLKNTVVGIDLDVVAHGFDLVGYVKVLRNNGAKRTLKTIARKSLLVDMRYRREFRRQLGVDALPLPDVIQMDGAEMTFRDGMFDVVYSFSVFSHVREPARMISEMARVLRPGGVAFASFLLYASRTGCMDLRVLGGRDADLPLWAHLRPAFESRVQESAYLNKIRLAEWRDLFEASMPGCEFVLGQHERDRLLPAAEKLHAAGELADYGVDELVTADLTVIWRKPDPSAT